MSSICGIIILQTLDTEVNTHVDMEPFVLASMMFVQLSPQFNAPFLP